MKPVLLDDAVDALRALGDDRDDAAASATRLKIRDSLARGHALRRHAGVLAALALVLVASGAWALTSGRIARWLAPTPHAPAVVPATGEPPVTTRAAPRVRVTVRDRDEDAAAPHAAATVATHAGDTAPHAIAAIAPHAPATIATHAGDTGPHAAATTAPHVAAPRAVVAAPHAVATTAPHVAAPHAVVAAPRTVDAAPGADEGLYRAAHALHFHGGDAAAALAAWDAYLAAAPHGRFAIEARYNRALCLVRLGRLVEARAALAPFAAGDVAPAGYRRDEAARLIARIDERLAPPDRGSGRPGANALNGSR